ncbi:MAG: hypothetical protein ACP5NE_02515 [Candidatus Micrarchaeia archaeon]
MKTFAYVAFAAALAILLASTTNISYGSYAVTNLNTTVLLNPNTSASVKEVLTVYISNESIQQYSTDRIALNLTLSEWQSLIGPMLTQHIINPKLGVYNFRMLPGAVTRKGSGGEAYILMSYNVPNVTSVEQTGPRSFRYSFNPNVLNFEHGASGEVLPANTTLNIVIPAGASITSVYPVPDSPASGITNNYMNVTEVSWFYGEPLSKFTLTFVITESLQEEVARAFQGVYAYLGIFSYVIIALVILLFIIYAYVKAGR